MHEWVGGDHHEGMHKRPPEMPDKGRFDGCAYTASLALGAALVVVGLVGMLITKVFS